MASIIWMSLALSNRRKQKIALNVGKKRLASLSFNSGESASCCSLPSGGQASHRPPAALTFRNNGGDVGSNHHIETLATTNSVAIPNKAFGRLRIFPLPKLSHGENDSWLADTTFMIPRYFPTTKMQKFNWAKATPLSYVP
jgi:hypothetical protein